ncbi:MAG: NUDIX domain-containing protein [Candidatus Pacearchaeota archaeon]|nr:NUDIX domain-containing protein [Candidatus Pacearchaeota archaeon]
MRENGVNKIEVHVAGICFYKNKVLVVRRSSAKRLYPSLWECGGGQVNTSENFEEAVKRRIKEELGIIINPIKVLGIYQIPTPKLEQKKIPGIKFVCEIKSFVNGKTPRISEEHSEFKFLSKEQIESSTLEFIPGVKEEIKQAFLEIDKTKLKAGIIHSKDIKEQIFPNKKVKDVLNEKDFPVSMAIVKKIGDDQKIGFDPTNVIYLVLEGKSTSFINGKKYKIEKGDFIISPKGTKYKNLGGVTLLAICYPKFDRTKRVYVK